jgi:hypothetical protein
VEQSRSSADDGAVRRFELLVPAWRRPGLLSEIEARCAAIGVGCQLVRRGGGSSRRKALILTVPAGVNQHAFAELGRWIHIHWRTRPYDPGQAATAEARGREDALAASRAWTSHELEFVIGRLVRREFLGGVESICASTGARCEWEIRRSAIAQRIAVTISGPRGVVDTTTQQVRSWAAKFTAVSGG